VVHKENNKTAKKSHSSLVRHIIHISGAFMWDAQPIVSKQWQLQLQLQIFEQHAVRTFVTVSGTTIGTPRVKFRRKRKQLLHHNRAWIWQSII